LIGFRVKRPASINHSFPWIQPVSARRAYLAGDVPSDSAHYCLPQQEHSDARQSDVKVVEKRLSLKAMIDYSAEEHA
jgi:hypothetical protein